MFDRNWRKRLKDVGQDLTNIEVNTILGDGMTGRKFPPYPEALYDIAKRYALFVIEATNLDLVDFFAKAEALEQGKAPEGVTAAVDLQPVFNGSTEVPEALTNGGQDFRRLRWAAKQLIDRQKSDVPAGAALDAGVMTILNRIHRNCGQLELMVSGFPDQVEETGLVKVNKDELYKGLRERGDSLPAITAVDLTRIRKIWEIGVDRIVLQSVLQLDGDIVFRADKSLDLNARAALVDAHRKFVDLGVTHWRTMFELLAKLMGSALGRLLPGR